MAQATFKRVPVGQLHVDGRYQRELDTARVTKMAENFDEHLFGALEVSQRNGAGVYYVFDGQHRLETAKILGIGTVPVLIHKKLTPEEEAEKFVQLQRVRKNVHPIDRFRASVFRGDARAMEIQRIVTEAGFQVRHAGPERGQQRAFNTPAALDKVYGLGVLPETLSLLDELWGGDDHSTDAPLVHGLGLFVKGYGGRINDAHKAKLRAVPPIQVVRRAIGRIEAFSTGGVKQRADAVAAEIRKTASMQGPPTGFKKRVKKAKATA